MSDDLAPIPREARPTDFRPFEDKSTAEERAEWARLDGAERAHVSKLHRDERDSQNGQRRNASATPSPTPSPLRPGGDSVPVPTPLGGDGVGHPVPDSVPKPCWEPRPLTEAALGEEAKTAAFFGGLMYDEGTEALVSGEPGVGKSMVLAALAAEEALAGRRVLYLDFERSPGMLNERLESAGLSELTLARIFYLRPTVQASPDEIRTLVADVSPALVLLDSYDAALAAFGLETKNEDIRVFHGVVVEPLRCTGANVAIADHVAKNREKRGRYSIGGQAKLALADVHLGLSAIVPLRRGAEGKLKVAVHKDTYGYLPYSGTFELRSGETGIAWKVRTDDDSRDDEGRFRPTVVMGKVSRYLELRPGEAISSTQIEESVEGKAATIRLAVDRLIEEGHAVETEGPRRARLVRLERAFDDEAE